MPDSNFKIRSVFCMKSQKYGCFFVEFQKGFGAGGTDFGDNRHSEDKLAYLII